jgi:hypothetical protein
LELEKKMRNTKFMYAAVFVCLLLLSFSGPALAQDWYGAVTYQVAFPTGDTKDFTNEVSFRGMGLDCRKTIEPNTTAGLSLGWNVFHERSTQTLNVGIGHISGTQDRYINAFPIMLSLHRYLGQEGKARPYAGLNLGGFIVSQRFDLGLSFLKNDEWEWGFALELGVVIPLPEARYVILNGKFNGAFTGESIAGTSFHLQYFSLNVGFAWAQR